MITTDLGSVTAYADAVEQGYTGTREEFGQVIANFADSATQVAKDRTAVEAAKKSVEEMQSDVTQKQETVTLNMNTAVEAAEKAKQSASDAEASKQATAQSEQNINNTVTAFDNHVEEKIAGFDSRVFEAVEQSKEEINTTKQQAINTITNQQDASVNIVKTEGEKIITKVGNDAKTVADDRATVEEATQTVLNNAQEVAQNTQTVASNTEKAAASAEGAKTSADNAAQSAKSVEDASKQIEQNKKDVDSLKEDISLSIVRTASNETKAYNVTDLFTLNGFLNKKGEFVSNTTVLCTDYIDAKKGEVYYLYISQDDKLSLPIAIYNTDKSFVKGVENKGNSYKLQYFEYTVEEDCLIRISSMNADSSLIYRKEFKNNSEVFDGINTKIGQLETYYENKTQYVLEHKTDDKYLDNDNIENSYSGGLVSDYIEVDEGDSIKAGSYVLYGNPVLIMYYANKKIYKTFRFSNDGFNTVTTVIPPMVKYIRISSLDSSKEINFQILRHKSLIDSIKESSKEKNYAIPNTYDGLAFTNTTSGYIQDNGTIQANNGYVTSDYIDLDNYDYFRLVSDYAWGACGYVTFDDNKQVLSYVKDSNNVIKRLDIVPQDTFPTAKYIRFCGTTNNLHVYVKRQTTLITNGLEEALETGNVLYHKKIAFCGDSFTEATNLGKTLYDDFIGCYKSFGWRIANRNKMKLYHDGISGSTMHVVNKEKPNDRYPFAYERYKNVPVDCDYIILQFGLNESNIADSDTTKGTKDSTDTTTMWGAWNTVLGYLIENHPTARIGIIMSDAWMPQSYYTTLKEICEWWGIPLLDLGGNPNVPVMNSGRRVGSGLILNPKVAELRNATFYNADGDAHPNDKGHEWRSTVIENWIRSL